MAKSELLSGMRRDPEEQPALPAEPPSVSEEEAAGLKPQRKRRAKVGQPCQCGCGGVTKGGKFLPGHDAKLAAKVRMLRAAREKGEPVHESLQAVAAMGERLMACSCCGQLAAYHESGMGPICREGRCHCRREGKA